MSGDNCGQHESSVCVCVHSSSLLHLQGGRHPSRPCASARRLSRRAGRHGRHPPRLRPVAARREAPARGQHLPRWGGRGRRWGRAPGLLHERLEHMLQVPGHGGLLGRERRRRRWRVSDHVVGRVWVWIRKRALHRRRHVGEPGRARGGHRLGNVWLRGRSELGERSWRAGIVWVLHRGLGLDWNVQRLGQGPRHHQFGRLPLRVELLL